jgi:hypothetical protein
MRVTIALEVNDNDDDPGATLGSIMLDLADAFHSAVAVSDLDGRPVSDPSTGHPTGRVEIEGAGMAQAIADVVADLADEWGIPETVARPVVEKFAAGGGQGGHDFAGEVRENTSYVVAEWMIHEAMFDGGDA